MTTIEGLQEAVSGIAGAVGRSVVGVAGRRSAGSGLVLAPGRILTNAHNLAPARASHDGGLEVTFADGRSVSAAALGVDPDGDVAVLEADTADAPAVAWNGATAPAIGTPVFGVANPGGRGLRVTFGLVSGTQRSFRGPRGRRIEGSIEHTAPLLPGSSGGPVVDVEGRLLGINTHRLGEGFYLAIPADDALRARLDVLASGNAPARPRLGIAVAPAEVARRLRRAVGLEEADGLLVRAVEEGGPAGEAGVREGDLITSAGGRSLATADDLFAALEAAQRSIELAILRGVERVVLSVSLDEAG